MDKEISAMRIVKDLTQDYEQFKFPGNGREGTCFLRVQARQNDQRIVILCSQLSGYHGTSVTNAIEYIVQRALSRLTTEGVVQNTPQAPAFSELIRHTTCIEHYPPNVGLAEKGSYALVSFDEGFNPVWNYVTREVAGQKAGVSDRFLTISPESLTYAG